jgi:hypothetical protein
LAPGSDERWLVDPWTRVLLSDRITRRFAAGAIMRP